MTCTEPAQADTPGLIPAGGAPSISAADYEESSAVTNSTDPITTSIIERLSDDITDELDAARDADKESAALRGIIEKNRQNAATARAMAAQYQTLIDHLEGRSCDPAPLPGPSLAERQRTCALALADLAIAGLPPATWTISGVGPELYGQVPHSGAATPDDADKARAEIAAWAKFLGVEVTEQEPRNGCGYVRVVAEYEGAPVDVWAALHLDTDDSVTPEGGAA